LEQTPDLKRDVPTRTLADVAGPRYAAIMILRLLLAVMLAFAAMPAAAHDKAMPMAHGMAMPHEMPDKAPPPHECIGCIAVADWSAERVTAPSLLPTLPPSARVAVLRLGAATPPALPPPRQG
jgi:hypothetical protein